MSYAECHYAECHYAESPVLFIIMLNVIMLSGIMLNVIMPSVEAPSLPISAEWDPHSKNFFQTSYKHFLALLQKFGKTLFSKTSSATFTN
jgi:hypothetical protein